VHNHPAIGVDTHVAYLSNLLSWTKHKDKHKIEKDLERLFPKKYWISINYALVRFGRIFKTRKKQEEKLREEKIIKNEKAKNRIS
jgi:endonuclease III